ncbi:MAG: transposase [Clostridiales bacterium]|nr:transposase [Clostridiales bacterium]
MKGVKCLCKCKLINREFQERFSSEEACERALFESKRPEGFVCPHCGGKHCYTISTRRHLLYECSACGYQASATAVSYPSGQAVFRDIWRIYG